LRIISGKYKGKRITIPRQFRSRPTTDFAKENLFNIISNYFDFEELSVLELFAGTGSISFEFASRGCTDIDLVESDYKTCMFIDKVISSLNLERIKPIKADVFKFIKYCRKTYDIIFADPPYELEQIDILPSLIFKY
jgi:16S rRNA (guanine966-N2)-methyltransferase